MVMPRCFSSGALSIWSNGVKLVVGSLSWSTLVMAAVSVVLPWSMCPMVPTFTWGFVRWNFCLAIAGVCLLYTSDAADEEDSVDLGGRRIIKKKKRQKSE